MSKIQKAIRQYQSEFPFLALVIFLGVLAGSWLLRPGYFNMHDDLQMMRQLELEKCFIDFQIPCRWAPDMGYGFGLPLFNYYPPLPYFIGQIIRIFGVSFVDTAKYTFFLSIVFSGLAMYILGRSFWGKLGGLASSSFYIWAPYRAVDIFVRGAMNESWSFVWFPLILWSAYKLISAAQFRYIIILALSWSALLLSHNLMGMIFIPVFAGWVLLWLIRERSWFTLPQLFAALVWGLGLAAFFTIPVFLEKNLVHVEDLVAGYYQYIVHFASTNQLLFSRFWGYGRSVWGADEDQMSFQIGHLHWVLPTIIIGVVVWHYLKTRRLDNLTLVTCYFFLIGWFSIFMVHTRSTFVWMFFESFLKFLQFPWRFLTLGVLSFSIIAGSFVLLFKNKITAGCFVAIFIFILIVLNKDYFRPEKMGPLTDESKFSGLAWELQQQGGIHDYLPLAAKEPPISPRTALAEVVEGKADISEENQLTNRAQFKIAVASEKSLVRVNIFQFPNWKVFLDNHEVQTTLNEDVLGRMHIVVPKGTHEVVTRFYDTPVRRTTNLITLVSLVSLLTVPLWRRR